MGYLVLAVEEQISNLIFFCELKQILGEGATVRKKIENGPISTFLDQNRKKF
jgi:hypothetical protein